MQIKRLCAPKAPGALSAPVSLLAGTPDLARLDQEARRRKGVKLGDPVMLRLFKQESELESGRERRPLRIFGPIRSVPGLEARTEIEEGDHQSPEGFYAVTPQQINPQPLPPIFQSRFPQRVRSSPRTNRHFPHGAWRVLVDWLLCHHHALVDELWRFVTEALDAGEENVLGAIFPFRLTVYGNLKSRKFEPMGLASGAI